MTLNIYMSILNTLSESQKVRVAKFFKQHGLIHAHDLGAKRTSEDYSKQDLDNLLSVCNKNAIQPSSVVVSESSLCINQHSPFIHVHLPIHLINHFAIAEVEDVTPSKHFNFLAGNYHYDRFMLLQGLYQKDLLKCTHWSAYRNVDTELHRQHHYTEDFLNFCNTKIPRTMKNLDVHNLYPEDVLHENLYVKNSFVKDSNNTDGIIFKDSAITITVDTMANTIPGVYESEWHEVEKVSGLTMYYTPKIIKPIKHKRPFINLLGKGKSADKYLQDMGFKTFNDIWSEQYYQADTPKQRVDLVLDLCYNLSKENISDIHNKTKDLCEYNYNILTKTDWIEWYLNQIQTTLVIRQATT